MCALCFVHVSISGPLFLAGTHGTEALTGYEDDPEPAVDEMLDLVIDADDDADLVRAKIQRGVHAGGVREEAFESRTLSLSDCAVDTRQRPSPNRSEKTKLKPCSINGDPLLEQGPLVVAIPVLLRHRPARSNPNRLHKLPDAYVEFRKAVGRELCRYSFTLRRDASRRNSPTDFVVKNGFQTSVAGRQDAFVAKLNPAGGGISDLHYATFFGGSGDDEANNIAADALGNAYIVGNTGSFDLPVTSTSFKSTCLPQSTGSCTGFVAKFNTLAAGGTSRVFATYLGGSSGDDAAQGVAVDSAGNGYVTGYTASSDFPTVNPIYGCPGCAGLNESMFVTEFSPAGSILFSTFLGGSTTDSDEAFSIAPGPFRSDLPDRNRGFAEPSSGDADSRLYESYSVHTGGFFRCFRCEVVRRRRLGCGHEFNVFGQPFGLRPSHQLHCDREFERRLVRYLAFRYGDLPGRRHYP